MFINLRFIFLIFSEYKLILFLLYISKLYNSDRGESPEIWGLLINIFITIKSQSSKDNSFDCYSAEEINYPELSDEEAFDRYTKK